MIPVAVQAGVSLVMMSGLAWMVRRMKMRHVPRIADDAHALRLAEQAEAGFDGVDVGRDRAGFSAIIRNAEGRMMLIRAHGRHFAVRPIDLRVYMRLDKEFLILEVPERNFGPVALKLGKSAAVWAARMRDLVPTEGRWSRINVEPA